MATKGTKPPATSKPSGGVAASKGEKPPATSKPSGGVAATKAVDTKPLATSKPSGGMDKLYTRTPTVRKKGK